MVGDSIRLLVIVVGSESYVAPQSPDGQLPPALGEPGTIPTCNVGSPLPGNTHVLTAPPDSASLTYHSFAKGSLPDKLVCVHDPFPPV